MFKILNKLKHNNYLRYFTIAIIVIAIFLLRIPKVDGTIGDEQRYIDYAVGLWNGEYSPGYPNVFIWNGPGYPIFLMPFVKIGLNIFGLRLINGLIFIISLILFDRFIQRIFNIKIANFVLVFMVFYIPIYSEITQVITESLTFFLIVNLVISFFSARRNYIKMGIIFGFLVLTKVIFSYILLACLCLSLLIYLIRRSIENLFYLKVFFVALLLNVPYLLYTYNLTGKLFYWANSGGVSLYWMSSPHAEEFGDWPAVEHKDKLLFGTDELDSLHDKELIYINSFPLSLRDDVYKKIAVDNIKNNPMKYIRNYISNFQRFFFNMPNSYSKHREIMLWYFPFNILLFLGFILICLQSFNVMFKNWDSRFYLTFILLTYVFLSCLVFTYPRFLNPIIPIIIFLTLNIIRNNIVNIKNLFLNSE